MCSLRDTIRCRTNNGFLRYKNTVIPTDHALVNQCRNISTLESGFASGVCVYRRTPKSRYVFQSPRELSRNFLRRLGPFRGDDRPRKKWPISGRQFIPKSPIEYFRLSVFWKIMFRQLLDSIDLPLSDQQHRSCRDSIQMKSSCLYCTACFTFVYPYNRRLCRRRCSSNICQPTHFHKQPPCRIQRHLPR